MKTKKTFVAVLVVSLITSILFTPSLAYAQDGEAEQSNFFVSIFHKLLQKFGLEKKIQTDAAKENAAKKENGQDNGFAPPDGTPVTTISGQPQPRNGGNNSETILSNLVKQGKITEAQKTSILAELKTLQSTYSVENMKDLTNEERKTKMEEMQTAFNTWAKENNITIDFISLMGNPEGDKNGAPPARKARATPTP